MLKTCSHIILAVWLALSSSGFVLQKHFCLDELQDVALYQKAHTCGAEVSLKQAAHPGSHDHLSRKSCCKDTVELFQLDQDFLSNTEPADRLVHELVLPVKLWDTEARFVPSLSFPFPIYRPPPLCFDLFLSLQNFRC